MRIQYVVTIELEDETDPDLDDLQVTFGDIEDTLNRELGGPGITFSCEEC